MCIKKLERKYVILRLHRDKDTRRNVARLHGIRVKNFIKSKTNNEHSSSLEVTARRSLTKKKNCSFVEHNQWRTNKKKWSSLFFFLLKNQDLNLRLNITSKKNLSTIVIIWWMYHFSTMFKRWQPFLI